MIKFKEEKIFKVLVQVTQEIITVAREKYTEYADNMDFSYYGSKAYKENAEFCKIYLEFFANIEKIKDGYYAPLYTIVGIVNINPKAWKKTEMENILEF